MKNLMILILTLATSLLTAQNTVIWNGGTPGNETTWDEPRNWSSNYVPDEFSFVIINNLNTGHAAQPTIQNQIEIASLEIHNQATLTITRTGTLIIDGEYTATDGIVLFGGILINDGTIILKNIDPKPSNKGYANLQEDVDRALVLEPDHFKHKTTTDLH